MNKEFHDRRRIVLVGIAAVMLGCGGPKSSSTSGPAGGPVPTSKMTLRLRVEAKDATTAVVRANLNDGKLTGESYRLDGGDFFRACLIVVCRNMADNDSLLNPDYIARLDYQPGTDYVVSFSRQQDRNAPDSRVTLPLPFSIVTPVGRQPVSDGDVVAVSWSPQGAPAAVSLDYDADCSMSSGSHIFSFGDLAVDSNADGRENVNIDSIIANVKMSASGAVISRCSITVKVSHELAGRVDPAFHNGTAYGIVSREVLLDYRPR